MGQASKYRARRAERQRLQAAKLLAPFVTSESDDDCDECYGVGCAICSHTGHHDIAAHLLRGGTFDVHAAREHALSLVKLVDEQTAFEDWCRFEHGKGPENREPGAFQRCPYCNGSRITTNVGGSLHPAGVWSGYVKRFGRDENPKPHLIINDGEAAECAWCQGQSRGGWPGKLARQWPGDPRAAVGRTLARQGQQLLDMLDGVGLWSHAKAQQSECLHCNGTRWGWVWARGFTTEADALGIAAYYCLLGRRVWIAPGPSATDEDCTAIGYVESEKRCEHCAGTGHNLRGVLPAAPSSPLLIRKASESWEYRPANFDESLPQWIDDLVLHTRGLEIQTADARTRVGKRGDHVSRPGQQADVRFMIKYPEYPHTSLDQRMANRAYQERTRDSSRAPRWQLAELAQAGNNAALPFFIPRFEPHLQDIVRNPFLGTHLIDAFVDDVVSNTDTAEENQNATN